MTRLRHLPEAIGLYAVMGLVGLLPVDAASNLGGFLGRTIGPRLPVTARARRNLRLVFPEMKEPEFKRIERGMWDNLGRVITEYPHLGRITDLKAGRITLVDIDRVYALRDQKKAGIMASAHIANWEIMAVAAARHGVDPTIVVRTPNNPLVGRLIDRLRGVAGGARTPKGAAGARKSIEVLRQGRILGLLFDQRMSDGIPAPFFGIEAMTAAAPAQLALKFRCPLIPMRIERTGPGRFRITSYPAIPLPNSGDRQSDIAQIMGELNRVLEGWIRERPEEWLWLHRRWPKTVYAEMRPK